MSKRVNKTKQQIEGLDSSLLIAKFALIGVIITAVLALVGVLVKAYVDTINARLPIDATQTAETKQTMASSQLTTTFAVSNTVTDTFDSPPLNANLWQPPSDPSVIFIENKRLIFQVTPQHAVNGVDAMLTMSPTAHPIREISLTMTMLSYMRASEGGVAARVFMSNGPDHNISITHDDQNTAVEFSICPKEKCNEEPDEYKHADPIHTQENVPVHMMMVWDGHEIALYTDGVKRDSVLAEGTPIRGFELSLWSLPDSVFELAVDDLAIQYVSP